LISDLTASQTFTSKATTTDVALGASDGVVGGTSGSRASVTISYDAAAQTYAVQTDDRSQTFGPDDEQTLWEGEKRFAKALSNGSDYLTLVTSPYLDPQYSNKYVGMGYWQRNILLGPDQQTYFSTFIYGFDTLDSSMPRAGAAHWQTDIFGLLTIPDTDLRIMQGLGDFDVDFAAGTFRALAEVSEYNYVTGILESNSQRFEAGGSLGSGNGFSGLFSYNALYDGRYNIALHGTLAGGFYGPDAEELGATFEATGDGAVLTGALTGRRSEFGANTNNGAIQNLTLTNPLAEEFLNGTGGSLYWEQSDSEGSFRRIDAFAAPNKNVVTFATSGVTAFNFGYTIDPADRVEDGRENFTTYAMTLEDIPSTISLYKIGSSNSGLQLTYSSFFTWSWASHPDAAGYTAHQTAHTVFGIETPPGVLAARTGTAAYSGVVYASGAAMDGSRYDVGGTSHFDVDFSDDGYDGWLQLNGIDQSGSARDFGRWTFDSDVSQFGGAILVGPGDSDPSSSIFPQFFGPIGQEIGASFKLGTGPQGLPDRVAVAGITLAKQQ
jgi:hypothetical protein